MVLMYNLQSLKKIIHVFFSLQAPSVSSKHNLDDDMDTAQAPPSQPDTAQLMGGFDFDPGFNQGFTQEQVNGMFLVGTYLWKLE